MIEIQTTQNIAQRYALEVIEVILVFRLVLKPLCEKGVRGPRYSSHIN